MLQYSNGSPNNRVLKAGDTMTGTLTSQTIIPSATATYTLGDSSHYYTQAYSARYYLNSTAYIDGVTAGQLKTYGQMTMMNNSLAFQTGSSGVVKNVSTGGLQFTIWSGSADVQTYIDASGNFTPGTDSAQTLGTSSLYWSNTYTDRLYLNSTAYLDGGTAGIVSITGLTDQTATLLNDDAWGTGGAGIRINATSGFNKYQAAYRGQISNSYAGSRTGQLLGLDFTVINSVAQNANTMYGTQNSIMLGYINGTTATTAVGTKNDFIFQTDNSGMSIGTAIAFQATGITSNLSVQTATVTTYYGFYQPVSTPTNVTITNRYGVYIADPLASNYFAGDVIGNSEMLAGTFNADAIIPASSAIIPTNYVSTRYGKYNITGALSLEIQGTGILAIL